VEPRADLVPEKLGVVVPTMGERLDYLVSSLTSLRAARVNHISIVCPEPAKLKNQISSELYDSVIADPKSGLAAAINLGISYLPAECKQVAWLGDDDEVIPGGFIEASNKLAESNAAVAVFGICEYVDSNGRPFWKNKSGVLAIIMLSWGPNRIPQPGSIFTRISFNAVGGLDESLGWAFDQDLFSKLHKIGKLIFIERVVSRFRWHNESLSAGQSERSRKESSQVRLRHTPLPKALGKLLEAIHLWVAGLTTSSLDRKVAKG
jgi:GT2 family glycosyltransferase